MIKAYENYLRRVGRIRAETDAAEEYREIKEDNPTVYAGPKCKHYLPCGWCEKHDNLCTWVG